MCLLAVIFAIGHVAGSGASALSKVVKAFAGGSTNSFTVYVTSVSGEYALKVATTRGTLRVDQDYKRLWAYSKVAVTVPYEVGWTVNLDRGQWSAERRGSVLVVHCPPPVAEKPWLDMTKLKAEDEATSLIISESSMEKDAQAKLLADAPLLVSKQERNQMMVQEKAGDAVKRLTREWLSKEFPEAKEVAIEVEFGSPPKAEASTK